MAVVKQVDLINVVLQTIQQRVAHTSWSFVGIINELAGVGLLEFSIQIDGLRYDFENRRGAWWITKASDETRKPVVWFMQLLKEVEREFNGVVQSRCVAGESDSQSGSEVCDVGDGCVRDQSGNESFVEG